MKIFLIVLLIIFLFLFCVLLSCVHVYIGFSENFKFKFRFWFFTFDSWNTKEKRKRPKKDKVLKKRDSKDLKEKSKTHSKLKVKNGVEGFLELTKKIVSSGMKILKDVMRIIKIDLFKLNIKIASDDAAKTALDYGKACAIMYPVVSVMAKNNKCIRENVTVIPDFQSEDGCVDFEMKFHVMIVKILWVAIKAGIAFLKIYKKNIEIKESDDHVGKQSERFTWSVNGQN